MASTYRSVARCGRRGARWRHLLCVVAVIAAVFLWCGLNVPQAVAVETEAADRCVPTAEYGCVNGILQDSDQKPIAGVTVTLGGAATGETTTADDGTWAFKVADDGKYTVTIAQDVAKQYGFAADSATVEIVKSSFSKQRGVVRFDKAAAAKQPSKSRGAADTKQPTTQTHAKTDESAASSVTWTRFCQQLYSGVIFGLLLGLMAVGMNLVYGTTGLSSFSHGEQVTLGGLMAYVGTQMLHMPVVLSAIFAIVIGGLTGLLQDQFIWGPLRYKRVGTMQQMIVTIGLSMALQYLYQFFFGGDIKGIVKSVPEGIQLGPITTNAPALICAGIALATIVGVTVFLYCTRLGRATRAVSDNAALAAASGINVDSVVRIVWTLSCALAALSGVLLGIYLNGIAWNTGVTLLMLMFAAVTLGGLGTANGALVGALVIGVVADLSTLVIPSDMRYASALAILILVLLVRPQGIFGKRNRIG
ncbi:SdrD B-like domain-containing protein [uncultured Bifidobacterium sp.]|uniref:ABC transporter permease subunit n=1 Tax=uncultured Bifidobacterium sp. TaxID=165187 RepID=UPI002595748F|nr:SdrD B-like domain-containing protein [uncultured Bifidobacterium sp.]